MIENCRLVAQFEGFSLSHIYLYQTLNWKDKYQKFINVGRQRFTQIKVPLFDNIDRSWNRLIRKHPALFSDTFVTSRPTLLKTQNFSKGAYLKHLKLSFNPPPPKRFLAPSLI